MRNGSFVINETNIGFGLEGVRTCELCGLHGRWSSTVSTFYTWNWPVDRLTRFGSHRNNMRKKMPYLLRLPAVRHVTPPLPLPVLLKKRLHLLESDRHEGSWVCVCEGAWQREEGIDPSSFGAARLSAQTTNICTFNCCREAKVLHLHTLFGG
jgi:hypothetical protein